MKTTFAIIALVGLAACAPPPKPICDPMLRTFAIPHGCDKNDSRPSAAPVAVTVPALPSVPEAPDAPPSPPETPDVPDAPTPPADPVTPPADDHPPAVTPPAADKPNRGNASANNGRGGNYDRTGHDDNGRGNGKGRP